MGNDNRVSASITGEDVASILEAINAIRTKLPFLLTLKPQERRVLPKMGDKSIGFDEKCVVYIGAQPQFMPAYIDLAEVQKDRDLREQVMRFFAELNGLQSDVYDTLSQLSSEVWMADLAYYHSVREAARRGRSGAEAIYLDLKQRFPGPGGGGSDPEPSAQVAAPAVVSPASTATAE